MIDSIIINTQIIQIDTRKTNTKSTAYGMARYNDYFNSIFKSSSCHTIQAEFYSAVLQNDILIASSFFFFNFLSMSRQFSVDIHAFMKKSVMDSSTATLICKNVISHLSEDVHPRTKLIIIEYFVQRLSMEMEGT